LPKPRKAKHRTLAALLAGSDLRSLGRANQIVTLVLEKSALFAELLQCMWSDDPVVRMRAADATEKISAVKPKLPQRFRGELLGLADESTQQEVQWHLALLLPRLSLNTLERRRAADRLKEYLRSRSSIVKTHALQGLWELAQSNEHLRAEVQDLLAQAARSGTAAMRARSRKLLALSQNRNRQLSRV
jgi:hypothetical protein